MPVLSFVFHSDADENPEFARWWQAWPKQYQIAKGGARREWYKLRPTKAQAEQWTQAVLAQAQSRKWKDGYVPKPQNWLRDERWDDYVEPEGGVKAKPECRHDPPCYNVWACLVRTAKEEGRA